jgi:hypothetical protein
MLNDFSTFSFLLARRAAKAYLQAMIRTGRAGSPDATF